MTGHFKNSGDKLGKTGGVIGLAAALFGLTACASLSTDVVMGDVAAVQRDLAAGADVNKADNKYGFTPLYEAVAMYKADMAKFLIAHGADVNQADKNGETPLNFAALNDEADMEILLLAHGADVNQADKNGMTPLYWTASHGHADVVRILLAHGADVNKDDTDGYTPLGEAALYGHADVVRILLAAGATPTQSSLAIAKDEESRTLIQEALNRQTPSPK